MVKNFDEIKQDFLFDIKGVVEMEEIPPDLIFNWDQTGISSTGEVAKKKYPPNEGTKEIDKLIFVMPVVSVVFQHQILCVSTPS